MTDKKKMSVAEILAAARAGSKASAADEQAPVAPAEAAAAEDTPPAPKPAAAKPAVATSWLPIFYSVNPTLTRGAICCRCFAAQ